MNSDDRPPRKHAGPRHCRRANWLLAVPAGGVMRITTELLLIGGLWLAVALFVVTVLIGWG